MSQERVSHYYPLSITYFALAALAVGEYSSSSLVDNPLLESHCSCSCNLSRGGSQTRKDQRHWSLDLALGGRNGGQRGTAPVSSSNHGAIKSQGITSMISLPLSFGLNRSQLIPLCTMAPIRRLSTPWLRQYGPPLSQAPQSVEHRRLYDELQHHNNQGNMVSYDIPTASWVPWSR